MCKGCKTGNYDTCAGGTRCDVNQEARQKRDERTRMAEQAMGEPGSATSP